MIRSPIVFKEFPWCALVLILSSGCSHHDRSREGESEPTVESRATVTLDTRRDVKSDAPRERERILIRRAPADDAPPQPRKAARATFPEVTRNPVPDRLGILQIDLVNSSDAPFRLHVIGMSRPYIHGLTVSWFANGKELEPKPEGDKPAELRTLRPGEHFSHEMPIGMRYNGHPLTAGMYQLKITYEVAVGTPDATPASLEKWVELEIIE